MGLYSGFSLTESWLWMRDHTGQRALKQNRGIQTQRQLDEWERELPPCLTDPTHPSFIENQIPHHQHHDCDINSQGSQRGLWVSVSVPRHCKRKPGSVLYTGSGWTYNDSSAITVWQYPAGSLGWSGENLWSQSAAKTPTHINRVCGKCATTMSQVM